MAASSSSRRRPVLGLWARHPITPFVISQLSTALTMLESDLLTFALKDEIRARGLLTVEQLQTLLAAGDAALHRAGVTIDEVRAATDAAADEDADDGPPGTIYLADDDLLDDADADDADVTIDYVTPGGEPLPDPLDATPVPAPDPTDPPLAWQWPLTLDDVLVIVTATDFLAKSQLGAFGEEMRYMQVDLQHNVTAEEFDQQRREMLHYLTRFQEEWRELFGHLPAYQQQMAALAELQE